MKAPFGYKFDSLWLWLPVPNTLVLIALGGIEALRSQRIAIRSLA